MGSNCSCDWPGCQGQCHTGDSCPCHPTPEAVKALAEAMHSAFKHGYHGGGWEHGDGDLAHALLDALNPTARAALARYLAPDTLDVDALRALSDAATPGPWRSGDNDGWETGRGWHVWVGDDDRDGEIFVAFTGVLSAPHSEADAAFIVAAVNYVRSLLEETRDAR